MYKLLTILLTICIYTSSLAQRRLELTRTGLGGPKVTRIFINDVLEYKLKEDRFYKKGRIVHLQDSIIVLENGKDFTIADIKAIKLDIGNHLTHAFQIFFVAGGVLFFAISAVNNVIVPSTPVVTEQVLIISSSLVATGLIIRELGIKRVRMNKNKSLRIVNIDYQNMNQK